MIGYSVMGCIIFVFFLDNVIGYSVMGCIIFVFFCIFFFLDIVIANSMMACIIILLLILTITMCCKYHRQRKQYKYMAVPTDLSET